MSKSAPHLREKLQETPWGPTYLREVDLIIAANEVESLKAHETLYNAELNLGIARRCMALDQDLQIKKMDTIIVPYDAERPWINPEDSLSELKNMPRGHWAVVKANGGYDAYMANGYGDVATESGYKFTKTSENAPDFNDVNLYSHVISYMIYLRRTQIMNEILEHSFREAGLTVGSKFKDIRINGKHYSNVELLEIKKDYYSGGSDAVVVRATRRGAKPAGLLMEGHVFAAKTGMEIRLPPEYDDPENENRLVPEFMARVQARTPAMVLF